MKQTAWVLVMVSIAVVAAQTAPKEKAFFRSDLKARGFKNQEELTESSVNFLSDKLLLVTINELWTIPTQPLGNVRVMKVPLNTDSPPSTFVLFDLDQQSVRRTSELAVQKLTRNVWAVRDNYFLILNSSGVKRCSADMVCGETYPTRGPVFVTPERDKVFVGGNAGTKRILLDTTTLEPVPDSDAAVTPFPSQMQSRYNRGFDTTSVFSTNGRRADSILHVRSDHAVSQKIIVYDRFNTVIMQTEVKHKAYWMPAISPNGTRVALVRDGVLEVFNLP